MRSVRGSLCTLVILCVCSLSFGVEGVLPGDGLSAATAFQIDSLEDFRIFANPENAATYWASDVHVELTDNISLAGEDYDGAVIAPDTVTGDSSYTGTTYQGTFHGNGFEISDMVIDDDNVGAIYVGLFGYAENAVIENLGVVNCEINVGIEGGDASHNLWFYGALCGNFGGGSMTGCYSTGDIAVVRHTNNTASNSILIYGGLVGSFYGTMDNCFSICNVAASSSAYANMQLRQVGGLCGVIYGSVSDSYAAGAVTMNIAGFSGTSNSFVTYYLDNIGGFCGTNFGTLENCYSSGPVQCSAGNSYQVFIYSIGGLVGDNNDPVYNCYTTSSVSAGAVADSWNAQCRQIGGLIGNNGDSVQNCYAAAEFSASASSNANTNTDDQGGLIGGNWGTVTASFWDEDVSDMSVSEGGTGKTTAQMQTESTFTAAGWDFDDSDGSADWTMGGYPQFTWQPVEVVDLDELETLAQYWLMTGCTSDQPCSAADWHTDGAINLLDLKLLAESWLGADMIYARRADMIDDFETGDLSALEWDSYYTDWGVVSDPVYEGGFSAKSAEITHNQSSYLYMTVDTTGFDTISFVCKVSSELDWDWLIFYIDGVEQGRWSGEQNWQEQSFPVTEGVHNIWWTFADDASGLAGANAAWIDNIRFFKAE